MGYFTDFSAYPTGAPPSDWTIITSSFEVWNVTATSGAISANAIPPTVSSAAGTIYANAASTSATDGDATGVVLTASVNSSGFRNVGIIQRAQSSAGFTLYLANDGSSGMSLNLTSIGVVLMGASSFVWNTNSLYAMRLRVTGTTVQGKAWAWPGAEPGAFQVTATSTSALTAGAAGLATVPGGGQATILGAMAWFGFSSNVADLPPGSPNWMQPLTELSAYRGYKVVNY